MRIFTILSFLIFLFIWGCANQTSPTGGPKDKEPPQLISSTPSDGQININPREIILEFDELIKLKNAKEQILITPRVDQEYEIVSKKNKAIIKFEKALNDSTTYTLNFRDGIQDITEGNAPKDLKLAFSTGPYLDSLKISGKINTLLSNQPAKDISVALYNSRDTLSILNGPPIYLTKTTKDGSYEFINLKKGYYRIYALNDKNKNLLADVRSESYGFYPNEIKLDSLTSQINFPTQGLNINPISITSARQAGTTYEIKLNKYITSYSLINDQNIDLYSNFTDNTHQIIQIFNPLSIKDSLEIRFTAMDSINSNFTDTLFLKFEPTKRTANIFESKITLEKTFVSDGLIRGSITFNKPIKTLNTDSFYIHFDSLNIYHFDSTQLLWNYTRDKLSINYSIPIDLLNPPIPTKTQETLKVKPDKPIRDTTTVRENTSKQEKKPHLYSGAKAFVSAEADSSKTSTTPLSFTKNDLFGIIIVEVKTTQQDYVVQLLDTKNSVIQSVNSTSKFFFNKVSPGDYRIRILVDFNNNGSWDPGNIQTNTPPEPVIFYKTTDGNEVFTIRANWELGPNIIEF